MNIIGQRNIITTVRKEGDTLKSESTVVGQGYEAGARLILNTSDFIVGEASFEVVKDNQTGVLASGHAEHLVGAVASFDGSDYLSRLGKGVGVAGSPVIRTLFVECVKGLTQAETFVIKERGFADEAAYEAYWQEREEQGCRFYSNPQGNEAGWFDHVGQIRREDFLFTRVKSCFASEILGRKGLVWGTLTDSYHEMDSQVTFDLGSGIIQEAQLFTHRIPSFVCKGIEGLGSGLVGQNAYELTRKDVVSILGGSQGCYHMSDLVTDLMILIQGLPERTNL